ncbi:protein of unknown function (plasmid) [Azospirillum baldaniorum]|uniref:Uncharacterized protein n=1 Tax=Azospirillum baldaniorum TaxID=1064539 RepID=A0A9P1JYN4_9PROT|nr:protein of unknown function [Azospirillum baldaniorum]
MTSMYQSILSCRNMSAEMKVAPDKFC